MFNPRDYSINPARNQRGGHDFPATEERARALSVIPDSPTML
jgi:hypothetical protein